MSPDEHSERPSLELDRSADAGWRRLGKAMRRERKRARDHTRLIDGWEQYRALWDGIEFKRQLINMGDKRARFALAIMAALNAALLVVLTRGPIAQLVTGSLGPWVVGLMVAYGAVTIAFVTHTVEALRPTAMEARRYDADAWSAREGGASGSSAADRPVGLFIRGPLEQISFEDEQRLWSNARLSDINAELVLFNRSSSFVLMRQVAQIRKVYQRLKVLVVLAAAVITLVGGASVARHGARLTTTVTAALR